MFWLKLKEEKKIKNLFTFIGHSYILDCKYFARLFQYSKTLWNTFSPQNVHLHITGKVPVVHFLLCRTLQSHHWSGTMEGLLTILDSWAYSLTLFGCKLTPECQNWSSKFSSWHYLAGRCKFVSLLPAFVQTLEPHLHQRCSSNNIYLILEIFLVWI